MLLSYEHSENDAMKHDRLELDSMKRKTKVLYYKVEPFLFDENKEDKSAHIEGLYGTFYKYYHTLVNELKDEPGRKIFLQDSIKKVKTDLKAELYRNEVK
jgi:hypothetical protein